MVPSTAHCAPPPVQAVHTPLPFKALYVFAAHGVQDIALPNSYTVYHMLI